MGPDPFLRWGRGIPGLGRCLGPPGPSGKTTLLRGMVGRKVVRPANFLMDRKGWIGVREQAGSGRLFFLELIGLDDSEKHGPGRRFFFFFFSAFPLGSAELRAASCQKKYTRSVTCPFKPTVAPFQANQYAMVF